MKKFLLFLIASLSFSHVLPAQTLPTIQEKAMPVFFLDYNGLPLFFMPQNGNVPGDTSVTRSANIIINPNPTTTGIVNVTSDQLMLAVQVYDVRGVLVKQERPDSTTCTVDISSFSRGVYIFVVRRSTSSYSEQVIYK